MPLCFFQECKSRLKKIGEELVSWPQLASEVTYGAGVVVGIAREIFLNRSSFTGRVSHKMPHI